MTVRNGNQRLSERRRNALWLIAGLLLSVALLFAANWEANRQGQVRMDAFRSRVTDLAKISESIIIEQLRQFDDVLLVLRRVYAADPKRFIKSIGLLRNGPLKDREILVVLADRDGYLAYADSTTVKPGLYLGTRAYFRYFADGGKDRFYVDEPILGRVTQRYSIPLVRPIYDKKGAFLGVIALSVMQESLANFGTRLQLSGDTAVTLITHSGAVAGRSRDLAKMQGKIIPPEMLAPMLKGTEGVFSSRVIPDGVERVVAYRHIHDGDTPLIVYVEASPANVLRTTSQQRAVLMGGAGLLSLVIMVLIAVYLKGRKSAARLIDTLRRSKEQEYETLTQASFDGFCITDTSGRILDTNDTFCKMLGYTREELLCLSIRDFEAVESPEEIADHIRTAIEAGSACFQSRYRRKDGAIIDVEISAQYDKESGGRFFIFIRDITDRKRAEVVLQKSRDLLAQAEKMGKVGGWEFDIETKQQTWTEMVYDIHELDSTGWPTVDQGVNFYTPASRPIIERAVQRAIEQDEPFDLELEIITAKGNLRSVHAIGSADLARRKVSGFFQDISERKQAEEKTRRKDSQYQELIEHAEDGIFTISAAGQFLFVNDKLCRMLGYTREEFLRRNILDTYPDNARPTGTQRLAKLQQGEALRFERSMKRLDGGLITVEACTWKDADGNLQAIVRDISDRKLTEEALRQSRRAALNLMTDAVAARDRAEQMSKELALNSHRMQVLLQLNQMREATLQEITDFALEGTVRLTQSKIGYLAFLNEDESVLTMHAWSKSAMAECAIIDKPIIYPVVTTGLWGEAVRQRRPVFTNDYAAANPLKKGYPQGHVAVKRHMNVPVFEGSRIVLVAGVGNKNEEYSENDAQQLTLLMEGMWRLIERRRLGEELQKSAEKYRNLFDNAMEGVYQSTPEGRLISANMAFARMFGYESPEEFINTVTDLASQLYVNQDDRKIAVGIFKEKGYIKDFECQVRRKDGSIFWARYDGQFTKTEDGIPCFQGFIIDITERKKAEEEIKRLNVELEQRVMDRTAQLESANKELEAFSYSVSHDLRAPLRTIDGFSKALLEEYQEKLDDTGKSFLERVRKATLRMGLLIDDMLKLSRITQAEMKRGAVDLSGMVRELTEAHQKSNPDRAVDVTVQEGIMVQGDQYLIKIAMENLVDNAWKFTGKEAHPRIEFGTTVGDGETACFIRDNGVGFDMAYVGKLFGAFQRLHASDEFPGTGIGLATVKRIITRHGGQIWAEGEIGRGATFYFTVPL